MAKRLARPTAFVVAVLACCAVKAAEMPSFLQAGEAFCTNEADFNDYVSRGGRLRDAATETCRTVAQPTKVAILRGAGGSKSMVRIMAGPDAYEIGWTDGKLPVQ